MYIYKSLNLKYLHDFIMVCDFIMTRIRTKGYPKNVTRVCGCDMFGSIFLKMRF